MNVSVVRETFPGERRVALVPGLVSQLIKAGCAVQIERNAGLAAGFPNEQYEQKGATIVESRDAAFTADVVLLVRMAGANHGMDDRSRMRKGQVLIGTCDPLGAADQCLEVAATDATIFGLELMPRITRAQSMDVLSSMATVAGYRAVLLAAMHLPKMFPLMMTAAGTLKPAKVFVIGAGVAGLQAIATAKRLGAIVSAYDVRPAVKEQVESLGAKFVELPIGAANAEDQGGYAKIMDDAFYQKQRQRMAEMAVDSDVIITTAAIPGRKSPLLLTGEAVAGMQPGSVIVDLAAERGGNCELSRPDQTIMCQGVTILGPTSLPSDVPYHASQMYAKNVVTFLLNMVRDGRLRLDLNDEIIRETLVAKDGELVHAKLRELLDLSPLTMADPASSR